MQVGEYRVMPLLSIRGRPELRLGGFTSRPARRWPASGPRSISNPSRHATAYRGARSTAACRAATGNRRPFACSASGSPHTARAGCCPGRCRRPGDSRNRRRYRPAPADAADRSDLDALLAGLSAPAESQSPAPEAEATDDLDALLASLNAEPPPPDADATEPDLDALLASLK